jgi:hypothetical protein
MSFSIRPYRRFSASSSQALPTALLAFLSLVPAAAAQGVGDFFFGELRAEIADLRVQLARCDGPPNLALTSDNRRARTLVQAKLNQLLKMGVMMGVGDPDVAGPPPDRPPSCPPMPPTT